jgi:signal transduction histidine kinase
MRPEFLGKLGWHGTCSGFIWCRVNNRATNHSEPVLNTKFRLRISRLKPEVVVDAIFSRVKQPAIQALETLAEHGNSVPSKWRKELIRLGIERDVINRKGALDFASLARRLRRLSPTTFRREMQKIGVKLEKGGVQLQHVLAALELLLDECIPYVSQHAGDSVALSFAHLHSLACVSIANGYAASWQETQQANAAITQEADVREARAANYVTRVYEGERRRFSHDLHDEIGHDLILLKLYLEMILLDVREEDLPGNFQRLRDAVNLVSHTIEAVRRLVLDLGPAIFDELGFMAAVKSYARQFSSRTGIQVSVYEGGMPEEIPLSHQIAMYRVLQGALSNVLKHANAKHVKVSIGSMKRAVLILVVEDDGAGFDVETTLPRRSFGLTAMRERVKALNGHVHIRSTRGPRRHGTRIEVDLPLPGSEESETT